MNTAIKKVATNGPAKVLSINLLNVFNRNTIELMGYKYTHSKEKLQNLLQELTSNNA